MFYIKYLYNIFLLETRLVWLVYLTQSNLQYVQDQHRQDYNQYKNVLAKCLTVLQQMSCVLVLFFALFELKKEFNKIVDSLYYQKNWLIKFVKLLMFLLHFWLYHTQRFFSSEINLKSNHIPTFMILFIKNLLFMIYIKIFFFPIILIFKFWHS